jgi:hypothetical protein
MNEILYVLITKRIEYDDSSDCDASHDVLKLHGIFTQEGIMKYKNEIKKLRDLFPMNSVFLVPLDRFLDKGMKL